MDMFTKEVYDTLSDIQEQVRKTMLEFRGPRTFKNCYSEAEAVVKHYFRGAENRSYFEELCIILAAWQIAAGLFPTVEVPKLIFPGDYYPDGEGPYTFQYKGDTK